MVNSTIADSEFTAGIVPAFAGDDGWNAALGRVLDHFHADSGTIHLMNADGLLALTAARHIPPVVLDLIRGERTFTGAEIDLLLRLGRAMAEQHR